MYTEYTGVRGVGKKKYFASSDPHRHRHKTTVIPACHGSDIYSDIVSGTSFWQGRGGEDNSDEI